MVAAANNARASTKSTYQIRKATFQLTRINFFALILMRKICLQ